MDHSFDPWNLSAPVPFRDVSLSNYHFPLLDSRRLADYVLIPLLAHVSDRFAFDRIFYISIDQGEKGEKIALFHGSTMTVLPFFCA